VAQRLPSSHTAIITILYWNGWLLAAAAGKFNGLILLFVVSHYFSYKCCQILRMIMATRSMALTMLVGRSHACRSIRAISSAQMKNAIISLFGLCIVTGVSLLLVSFGADWNSLLFFFALDFVDRRRYCLHGRKETVWHAGLGDLSVLIFFGLVGVMGSLYLFNQEINWTTILPALSCGFFSIGVLNINNTRDIESDLRSR